MIQKIKIEPVKYFFLIFNNHDLIFIFYFFNFFYFFFFFQKFRTIVRIDDDVETLRAKMQAEANQSHAAQC